MENQNWLTNYYIEEDKDKRKEILLQNMNNGSIKENELRLQLWFLRYAPREKASSNIDYFVKSFMELITESKISLNLFNRKAEAKRMNRIMENLGIIPSDLFSCNQECDATLVNHLLSLEYAAFAAYYMHFSSRDHHYGSAFMGSITLKEAQVTEKLARDFKDACIVTPRMFGLEDSFAVFKNSCFDSFLKEHPQQRGLLS